jgi:hypothetical protein
MLHLKVSAVFAAILVIGVIGLSGQASSADETASEYEPWAALPDTFTLSTSVQDDEGNPIWGAKVFIDGKQVTKSSKSGHFEIEEPVTAQTHLTFQHRYYADRTMAAGDLMNVEGAPVPAHLVPYTSVFNITPEGGIYQSGELTLEVPPGALHATVQAEAAVLPLDYVYNNDGSIEPRRLTAVALKPHGLKFKKPVTLTMTIAREDISDVVNPKSFYFDEARRRHVEDPDSKVEVVGHRVALTLNNFSIHSTADGRMAQSVKELKRSPDLDRDGLKTSSDAYFMVLVSGGLQKASANFAQVISGTVLEDQMSGSPIEQHGKTRKALTKLDAGFVAEQFSKAHRWERSMNAILDVSAKTDDLDCKMLLGRHDISHAVEWEQVVLSSSEQMALRSLWGAENKTTATSSIRYIQWPASQAPSNQDVLSPTSKIAVSKEKDGFKVYVRRSGFFIARPRNLFVSACDQELGSRLSTATQFAMRSAKNKQARHLALENNFKFGYLANTSKRTQWGTLNRDDIKSFEDLQCGKEVHQRWHYSISYEDMEEDVSYEPMGGPFVALEAKPRIQTRLWSTQASGAAGQANPSPNSVEWWVLNGQDPGERVASDYLRAGLYKQTADGLLPFGLALIKTQDRPCTIPGSQDQKAAVTRLLSPSPQVSRFSPEALLTPYQP